MKSGRKRSLAGSQRRKDKDMYKAHLLMNKVTSQQNPYMSRETELLLKGPHSHLDR